MYTKDKKRWDYRAAGVDIDAGNSLIRRIKALANATRRPGVIGSLGGFGALFDLSALDYQQPILVSTTDGVGTKIKLAIKHGHHDSIGIDLVAMCVNDLIVQGATPLFFLDYLATGRLDVTVAEAVIQGIRDGCLQSGCSLVGGETAEMPGMYADGDYDLAGFCVGAVEKKALIDGHHVRPGDALIALAASGCHANGYSLIRAILDAVSSDHSEMLAGRSIIEHLLEPTRIYVSTILHLLQQPLKINAIAHITGGGLIENIPRILPDTMAASIDIHSWDMPAIFKWLMDAGNIDKKEMYRTFNCGVGMVLCVAARHTDRTIQLLNEQGEAAWHLGIITERSDPQAPMISIAS